MNEPPASPGDLPTLHPLSGPAVWSGSELAAEKRWRFDLDPEQVAELEEALAAIRRAGTGWRQVRAADHPLPATGPLLAAVAEELETGTGVARIRGLDPERYDAEDRRRLFYLIGGHLGTPVSMSREGMMMSDVTDEGAAAADRYGAIEEDRGGRFLSSRARVHSTGPLRYHNDRADVVALFCVAQAKSGGLSRIASVPAVHNAMLAERPDLLAELFRPYHRSRLGEEFTDNAGCYALPIFAFAGEDRGTAGFTTHYSRTYIEAAQKHPEVPAMRPAQWAAIEVMAETADRLAFETSQQPGEIQLLNNHLTFHSRTAYEDHRAPARRRLLHRLWLAMPNSRALPESFAVLFHDIRPGAVRGGIRAERAAA